MDTNNQTTNQVAGYDSNTMVNDNANQSTGSNKTTQTVTKMNYENLTNLLGELKNNVYYDMMFSDIRNYIFVTVYGMKGTNNMKVTQLKDIVNSATSEVLGKTDVVNDDLSNLVDVGNEIFDTDNVDNYVKKLIDRIGQVIFVNRLYAGGVPSVLMDSWEYGSVVEKISADMPEADENDSWNLQNGQTYSQDTFYQPKVSAKFFNSKVTFDVKLSFTTEQVKESFSNVNELNGFISMLVSGVKNSMSVKFFNSLRDPGAQT